MTDKTINTKVRELEKIEAEIKALEEQAEKIKKSLQTEMGDSEELQTNNWIITWKFIISTRLDSKTLKSELPDLYAKYSKESTSRRFGYKAK